MSADLSNAAAPNPLSFFWQAADAVLSVVERATPPEWLQSEAQARLVLLINHVLQQEPQAMERLKRHAGKRVVIAWRRFTVDWVVTRAGLIDLSATVLGQDALAKEPDLRMTVQAESTADLFQALTQGQAPHARIEGDVQFAAEVGWLSQHVRWDIAEDLARVLGDAPAQAIVQLAQGLKAGLQAFVTPKPVAQRD